MGLDLTKFLIENVSLPPEVEAALDKRSSMGIIGNMNAYTQFQTANAIDDAAKSGGAGGLMGAGLGMGMGMNMSNQMTNAYQQGSMNTPPPPPPVLQYFVAVNGAQTGPFTM